MGRIGLKEEEYQQWVYDHVREDRYVVFFDRTGLRVAFWVLPSTRNWQFATLVLTSKAARETLEKILKERNVKFFNAEVDWGLGRIEFWTWTDFKNFCEYYVPDRSYEALITDIQEIILLPKPATKNLIKFFITLTSANKPEKEGPKPLLDRLGVPSYLVIDYAWSSDTAATAPVG